MDGHDLLVEDSETLLLQGLFHADECNCEVNAGDHSQNTNQRKRYLPAKVWLLLRREKNAVYCRDY